MGLGHEINTEIVINASQQAVWDTLINFEAGKDWNPFIVSGPPPGEVIQGNKISVSMRLPGDTKAQTFRPVLIKGTPLYA